MNPELLLDHFDRISEAPDAIPRLRRFILDLAVRGKLVEQDSTEEPASELLEQIEHDTRDRKTAGKFSEPRNAIEIPFKSLPFEVPTRWRWARLIEIADVSYGFAFESSRFNSNKLGIPLIRIRDISDIDTEAYYEGEFDQSYVVTEGDYLVGMDGDFNVRKWKGPNALLNQRVMRIRNWRTKLAAEFFAIPLQIVLNHLHISTSQTTVKHLSAKQVNGIYLPLPPSGEQLRIVAKVDELMALCDRLEIAQDERETWRELFAAASRSQLNNGANAEDFRKHGHFYLGNLRHLSARPEQIKQFRQTIVNLAIRGQLVSQNTNDEPASSLLVSLAAATGAYASEQGIAPPNPQPIKEEDLPHAAPDGWMWTRLCNLFNVITDGDHQPPPKADDGVAFLTIGNITTGYLDFSNCRFVSKAYLDSLSNYRKPAYGDILYTVVGATYGRPALVDTRRPFCVQRHIAILKPTNKTETKFLLLLLASPLVYEQATLSVTGAAQPTIPLRPLRNLLVPLPPIAEQRRIVAKVEELMSVCGRLELQLTISQKESRHLLDAVLHQTLSDSLNPRISESAAAS
jgi:type I restriction enzyme, S subunit